MCEMKKIFCEFLSIILVLAGIFQMAFATQVHATIRLSHILLDPDYTPSCIKTLEFLDGMLKASEVDPDTENVENLWSVKRVQIALKLIFLRITFSQKFTSMDLSFSNASGTKPSITIRAYLQRFLENTYFSRQTIRPNDKVSMSTIITLIMLLDTLQVETQGKIVIESKNIHRLFAAAYLISLKFCEDTFPPNSYMAQVAGISLSEMNRLEREFLIKSEFIIIPSAEEFQRYQNLFENLLKKIHNIDFDV